MKILIIHNTYRYTGGEETYLNIIQDLLRESGNEVYVYTKNSSEVTSFWNKICAGLGLFWNSKTASELTAVVREFKPDIVQFQNIFPLISPSAYWVFSQFKIPMVQRVSNYRLLCPKSTLFREGQICELCINKQLFLPSIWNACYGKSAFTSFFYSLAFFFHKHIMKSFSLIDMYIFPSQFTMKYIARNFLIEDNRVMHMPSPINNKHAKITRRLNSDKYFVYGGRMSEEKGIFDLIDIFSEEKNKNMKLILIGDGPDKSAAIVRAHGARNIFFKNSMHKSELHRIMAYSVAVIAPSKWFDVQPNVILEALSLKVPVIVPDRANFKEVVNKDSGLFYRSLPHLQRLITLQWNRSPIINREKIVLPIEHTPQYHYKKLMALYKQLILRKRSKN